MARAVRDHLADCTNTLPMLVEQRRLASLHLFVANLGAMRKQLFPSLVAAYGRWRDGGDIDDIQAVAERGADHWRELAGQMIALHERHASAAALPVAAAAEAATL
jgi:hypothetical protein